MKETSDTTIVHEAAVAAAHVVIEEFFPHCPNGIASAIHERLCEIIETAIDSCTAARWRMKNEQSQS